MAQHTFESLCGAKSCELESLMRTCPAPSLDSLAGREYNGWNTPLITRVFGFQRFRKGFYRPEGVPADEIGGYNVAMRQGGGPEVPYQIAGAEPRKFGFYRVYRVRMNRWDNKYPNAILLDYCCSRNLIVDPTRTLRDYLVQVSPGEPDLLLGKAYVALGLLRLPVSYFVLGRAA